MTPPYVPLRRVYSPAVARLVQRWLEGLRGWQVQQSDHHCFEGMDLNFHAHEHSRYIRHLVTPALLAHLEAVARRTWGVAFAPAFHLEARRFRPGDYTAPHTDAALDEMHTEMRTIVMFSSSAIRGGDLVFHGEGGTTLAPKTNTGAAFICSRESAHSVTRVRRGHRFSVCYRFGVLPAGESTRTARP